MSTQYYSRLTVIFEKQDDGRWTATCGELGTATFGNSLQDAQNKIGEAICLHLNTLEDVGERERFLKENNITLYDKSPKSVRINVPTDPRIFIHPQFYPLQLLGAC
ncbi:MAG: type II toxin-antitoxin system HicB family antitoxin [bacterium]